MNFLQPLKGTKDFTGTEQLMRKEIRDTCERIFLKYGYGPYETAILQPMELLAYKYGGGAEILKEVYNLQDQGERELGLRYDLTIPFTKVVAGMKERRFPIKRYEIGKVFRNGPVKVGRLREFTQCDVDIVGVSEVGAELELFMIAAEILETLGLEFEIQVNNRKLLVGILEEIGIGVQDIETVVLSIDKLEKIGVTGVEKELIEKGIARDVMNGLTSFLNGEQIDLQSIKDMYSSEMVAEGIGELEQLIQLLDGVGLSKVYRFNPFLARGLSIYTGTVYEIFLTSGAITSAIGSGGRYDKIVGEFINDGKSYPTVGLSLGLDVLYYALLERNNKIENRFDLYIIPLDTLATCMNLANELRAKGVKVGVELSNRKLKNSMNYANKEKIPYVLVVGENEINENKYVVKDMVTGEGRAFTKESLIEWGEQL